MLVTRLTELVGITHPILQAGMAWVANWELAVAVSEAGGLGILGVGNAPGEWVATQIGHIVEHTSKPYGINLPLFSPYAGEIVDLCARERVPVLTTGSGNPAAFIPSLRAGARGASGRRGGPSSSG